MPGLSIKDPDGLAARVWGDRGDGRLAVDAVSRNAIVDASAKEDAYTFCSASVALTSTSTDHGILYIINESEDHVHVSQILVTMNDTSANVLFKICRNPTGGTLISNGTEAEPPNLNFASGSEFGGTMKRGVNGSTVTGGTTFCIGWTNTRICERDQALILKKGNSLAIIAYPDAAVDVCVNITGFMCSGYT